MGAGGLPETVGKGVDGACGLMAQCQKLSEQIEIDERIESENYEKFRQEV